ncbi:unnamed protein product [Rhizopus stolonifer]
MFNNTHWSLPWLNYAQETQKNNVLEHLPESQFISFDSMIKSENYSVYDPFLSCPSYSVNLNSPHDSSCSEGTPVSDYFASSVTGSSSPVSYDDDLYIPQSPPVKKRVEKRGRRVKKVEIQEEKTFPCEFKECGKMFGRQEHVKRHPYVCPYTRCQKKFARSDNLNQHIRTHRKTSKEC